MVGWNPSYNWSYEEYRNVVGRAFINDDTVTLDTELYVVKVLSRP